MTNLITLTIPNDDHVALRAFGKALEEMALAHGAEPQAQTLVRARVGEEEIEYLTRDTVAERLRVATEDLQQAAPRMMQELRCEGDELQGKRKEPEVDTTAQQVESLATNVVQREVEFNNPPPETSEATTDSTGTPWDERIHSASKALNADGTWRLRRKPKDMDEAEWTEYVKSIQSVLSGETPTREEADELIQASDEMLAEIRASIEPPVTPPGDDFHTDADVVTEQTVAGIPPIPVPPMPLVVPRDVFNEALDKAFGFSQDEQWDFPKLMKFLTERHGKIDVPTVNQLLAVDGLAALTDLNAHPDKIGPFVARVKTHLGE